MCDLQPLGLASCLITPPSCSNTKSRPDWTLKLKMSRDKHGSRCIQGNWERRALMPSKLSELEGEGDEMWRMENLFTEAGGGKTIHGSVAPSSVYRRHSSAKGRSRRSAVCGGLERCSRRSSVHINMMSCQQQILSRSVVLEADFLQPILIITCCSWLILKRSAIMFWNVMMWTMVRGCICSFSPSFSVFKCVDVILVKSTEAALCHHLYPSALFYNMWSFKCINDVFCVECNVTWNMRLSLSLNNPVDDLLFWI